MWTACHRRPRARLDLMCSAYSQPIPTSASADGGGDIVASFVSPKRRRNVGPDAAKASDGQNERSTWRVFDKRKTLWSAGPAHTSRWWTAPCSAYMCSVQCCATGSGSRSERIRSARSMSDHWSSRLIAAEPTKAAAVMRSSSLAARTRPSRIRTRWATVNIDRVSHYACCPATAIVGEDRFALPRTGLPVGRARVLARAGYSPCPYSPKCLEDVFSEACIHYPV